MTFISSYCTALTKMKQICTAKLKNWEKMCLKMACGYIPIILKYKLLNITQVRKYFGGDCNML